MRPTPTFSEAIRKAIDAALWEVYTALPGRVESYDSAKGKANIKPLIKRGYLDEEQQRQVESLPVIPDVPICFPGTGRSRLTFEIQRGDLVLLVFCKSSLDKWLQQGGEVDPLDDRHHTLSDAVALVGLNDFAHVLSASPEGTVLEGDDIRLGAQDADDPVVLKSDLDLLRAAISAYATANPSDPSGFAASLNSTLAPTWPAGAEKVKAK